MKKILAIIGIVLGIVFIGIGFFTDVPGKHISWATLDEYVGGDAYNYIIEAALRGGRISGRMTSNAIYINCGTIIALYSAFQLVNELSFSRNSRYYKQNVNISEDNSMSSTSKNDDDLPNL